MQIYIVWDEKQSEGFATTDAHLAYEVRKSSDTNCYHLDGTFSKTGAFFCNEKFEQNCTIQTIDSCQIQKLQNEIMYLKHRNQMGETALRIVAEFSAMVPLKDSLKANQTGKTLIEYFRKVIHHDKH